MDFFLYIVACLSAIALVSSRPRDSAAVEVAEVKREANALDHAVRMMNKGKESRRLRDAIEGTDYGCERFDYQRDCWRICGDGECDFRCDVDLQCTSDDSECAGAVDMPCKE